MKYYELNNNVSTPKGTGKYFIIAFIMIILSSTVIYSASNITFSNEEDFSTKEYYVEFYDIQSLTKEGLSVNFDVLIEYNNTFLYDTGIIYEMRSLLRNLIRQFTADKGAEELYNYNRKNLSDYILVSMQVEIPEINITKVVIKNVKFSDIVEGIEELRGIKNENRNNI